MYEQAAQHFAVLRALKTSTDDLPPAVMQLASPDRAPHKSITPEGTLETRRIQPGRTSTWLVTDKAGQICLFGLIQPLAGVHAPPSLEERCVTLSEAMQGKLRFILGGSSDREPAYILGVVPDNVSSVVLSSAAGHRRRVAIVNNSYVASFGAAGTLTLSTRGGQHLLLPVPPPPPPPSPRR